MSRVNQNINIIRNSDVERYRLVYKWVDSEGVKEGGVQGRSGNFTVVLQNFTGPLSQ